MIMRKLVYLSISALRFHEDLNEDVADRLDVTLENQMNISEKKTILSTEPIQ